MDWSDIPSLAALRAFEAAARHRSFTAAAGELNVTHAAIAHHVRRLEADLDETLITREGRGIAVTPTGRDLADALGTGFATIAEGVGRIRDSAETRPLMLSVTPSFAANWLMPRIGDFWARHPEIQINIAPSTELVDLRRDGIDMAIRYGDGSWPDLRVELLTDGDFWAVAHPKLLSGRVANCLGDVTDLPWVIETYLLERSAMIEAEGVDMDRLQIKLMNSNALALSAVQAGLGVSLQPKSLVERQVAEGTLVRICALDEGPLGYYALTVPDRTSPRLRILRRWLHGQVAGES